MIGGLTVPEVLDPFIVAENPQSLGDRLVDAAGANFNRMFNFLKIEIGNCARLQSQENDLSYSFFLRQTPPSKTPVFSPLFSYFLPRNSGGFANFDLIAEFFDATRETLRGPLLIHAGEVERPEIAIGHLIPQQIISRGQDRSGYRDNGLLWTAPCA